MTNHDTASGCQKISSSARKIPCRPARTRLARWCRCPPRRYPPPTPPPPPLPPPPRPPPSPRWSPPSAPRSRPDGSMTCRSLPGSRQRPRQTPGMRPSERPPRRRRRRSTTTATTTMMTRTRRRRSSRPASSGAPGIAGRWRRSWRRRLVAALPPTSRKVRCSMILEVSGYRRRLLTVSLTRSSIHSFAGRCGILLGGDLVPSIFRPTEHHGRTGVLAVDRRV